MKNQNAENKKISIIVPVYNGEAYLERCLVSLLGQTYGNTEILLIDDGSADNSGQMCDKYAQKQDNIRVLHIKNAGVSSARNLGLEECTGDYVTFVDADDYLKEDMLEHLVKLLETSGSDVAGCNYFAFGQEEETADLKETAGAVQSVEILEGREFIGKGILSSDTRCWSKLYRRNGIGTLRFDTGISIGEDMLFLLKLAQAGKRFCRSGYKGYGYFMNQAGAMNREFKASYMDQITCWQEALSIVEKETPHLVSKAVSIVMISVMLVVGKLALLPADGRRQQEEYWQRCLVWIKEYRRNREAFKLLPAGYKVKVLVYGMAPKLYMACYHGKHTEV